jgi:uncharacterized protein with HEPN domain
VTADDLVLLREMHAASQQAIRFVGNCSIAMFAEDELRFRAAERCLEIVGEAAGQVSPQTKLEHPTLAWREASDMRNLLIHGYRSVRPEIVFRTIVEDIPVLVGLIEAILESSPP